MNNLRDFALAREQGWYRIPLKRAPAQVGADYLAFYQTAAFGQDMWRIRYYAAVRSYRIVTRAELLPDEATHPRAADRYYRIDIAPLQELPYPIPSLHLRRVTFIPTTLPRLLSAREINDLWETRLSAQKLWTAFREADIQAEQRYQVGEGPGNYVVDFAIPCSAGPVAIVIEPRPAIELPGWLILHFSEREILDNTPSCLDRVRQAIQSHGGGK
jgi:hypothetical protein